jgi:chromosomal replication initiation ATPase DnaA
MPLPFVEAHAPTRDNFVVSPANAEALEMLDQWPAWPDGRLALVGPEGAGKTHLAQAWARAVGAVEARPGDVDMADLEGRPVLLEDADRAGADADLFSLINRTDAGSSLLITARSTPRDWPASIPDLRSRFNALHTASLSAPDDAVLIGLLKKFFRIRNIRPDDDLLSYLLRRMERSAPAAWEIVVRLDEAAGSARREVNRNLAREVLESAQSRELFE